MRLKKAVILSAALFLLFLLVGCTDGKNETAEETISDTENTTDAEKTTQDASEGVTYDIEEDIKKNGFYFVYNGNITVYLGENTERCLSELGEEQEYFEAQSCAFNGIGKNYYYNGFEISTFQRNPEDFDHVLSVVLKDDSVSTSEGVYIGQTTEDMIAIYGENYEEIMGYYTYTKEGTELSFQTQEGIIISITYNLVSIY